MLTRKFRVINAYVNKKRKISNKQPHFTPRETRKIRTKQAQGQRQKGDKNQGINK